MFNFIIRSYKLLFFIIKVIVILKWSIPTEAAEILINPREIIVEKIIREQSPTLVVANDVNVRNLPTKIGNGGFVFAQLEEGDNVYVLGCEGFYEGHFWIEIWIPEIGEIGFVAAEFLQNNYQHICERSRSFSN